MIDIFDTKNLSDLPDKLIKNLKINPKDDEVMELFKLKNILNINEIIIGIYRKYKIYRSRDWVTNKVYTLNKTNKIKRIKYGTYMIVNNSEEQA